MPKAALSVVCAPPVTVAHTDGSDSTPDGSDSTPGTENGCSEHLQSDYPQQKPFGFCTEGVLGVILESGTITLSLILY